MGKKILFMEDEETIREVLSEYMNIAGYKVTGCSDGDKAINELLSGEFDLAVLDIMVPGPDGLTVLDAIRNKGCSIPVIMLTALGDEKTELKAFNAMADDFITKPVSPIILIKRIESLLRRAQMVMGNKMNEVMKEKGLFLMPENYSAYFSGENLNLTVTEYLILEMLMSRPKMIFTRDQLINHAFGEEYVTSPRIIDTHVKNLRKKLPENIIKTVIGVGYQIKEGETE